MYPITYLFKVYPRIQTYNTGDQSKYFTTFFYGTNGDFQWGTNWEYSYYGGHPYPYPDRTQATAKWEIAYLGGDMLGREQAGYNTDSTAPFVSWNQWYSQAYVAATSGHRFYLNLPNGTGLWSISASGNPATTPPSPIICMGQAADDGTGHSWGGMDRWEEANEIIRGIQIYTSALTEARIVTLSGLDTDSAVLAQCASYGITPWYLNMNPRPTDVLDKSGSGHHPTWEGTARPTEYVSGESPPVGVPVLSVR
jgi:hypothetical protein